MKEPYISPQLHIFCFAPREQLASLRIDASMSSVNVLMNASTGETDPQPGDVFLPIIPKG